MRKLLLALCLVLVPATTFADWELYDDFSSSPGGLPSTTLWDTVGNVTVENGEMKIVFSNTDDPSIRPEATNRNTTDMYGIKFDYRVTNWNESVPTDPNPYFRIVRHFGTHPDAAYPRASALIASKPDDASADIHHFRAEYTGISSDWNLERDLSAHFHEYYGDTYLNTSRSMSLITTSQGLVASLDGYVARIPFDDAVALNSEPFQLEIRPRNTGDEYTVYIDNVYVWKGEPTDIMSNFSGTSKVVVIPMF